VKPVNNIYTRISQTPLPVRIASSIPEIDESDAISAAESAMNAPYNGYPVQIEYFAKEDGSVALVHCIQIQDADKAIWSEVYVDAHSGDVVSSTNFVAKASVCPNIPSNVEPANTH